jgi:purine-nucleoside phosphorylase
MVSSFAHYRVEKYMATAVKEALGFLTNEGITNADLAIVLGSGLGNLVDLLTDKKQVPTAAIPHFPASTISGHFGNLVAGKRNGRRIIALQGRTHYYEGYSQQSITFGIRLFKALGAKVLILTNAAGAVNTGFRPGDLMVVDDHINAFWDNPLRGRHNPAEGPRFPDMSSPYDQKLIRLLEDTAQENRIAMRKGVLYGLSGPTYETAAEVRMIRILGGDTANMSTVPECIMANYLGLRVCAISLITNMATGLSVQPLSHEEVTAVGRQANGKMLLLLKEFINKLILQNEI